MTKTIQEWKELLLEYGDRSYQSGQNKDSNAQMVANAERRKEIYNEIISALPSGEPPQPRCPRCKESKLRFIEGSDLVGWLGKMLCESGKCQGEFSYFDIENWTDFAQFFGPSAPRPLPDYKVLARKLFDLNCFAKGKIEWDESNYTCRRYLGEALQAIKALKELGYA